MTETTPVPLEDLPSASTPLSASDLLYVSQSGAGRRVTAANALIGIAPVLANLVFAGPASGGSAAPAFRSLVALDIPSTLNSTTISGTLDATSVRQGSHPVLAYAQQGTITAYGSLTIGSGLGLDVGGTLTASGGVNTIVAGGVLSGGTITASGTVGLAIGAGLSSPGTGTIANAGVLAVGTITGTVSVGSGLSQAGGSLSNSGVLSLDSAVGALLLGNGLTRSSQTILVNAGTGLSFSTGTLVNAGVLAINQGTLNATGTIVAGPGVTLSAGGTLTAATGTMTSVTLAGGTTGLTGGTVSGAGGTITLGGTLAVGAGGTGLASWTTNTLVYANGTASLAGLVLGTNLSISSGTLNAANASFATAVSGTSFLALNTPITSGGTMTLSVTGGTATAVPYFANSTSLAVSGALTSNSIMLASSTGPKTVAGMTTDGLSVITIGGTASARGQINLGGNSSGSVGITVAAAAGSWSFVLPTGAGSSGQPLLSAAGGTLTWGTLGVAAGGTGLTSGTSGGVIGFTGTATLASSVLLTANALILGGGLGATPTPMASLGTTTTVLHGNAAGAPTFGAVSLTADVSGTLPVGNGGTGITNTPYVMLEFPLDGGGLAVTTGYKMYNHVDFAATVTKWTLLWFDSAGASVSESATLDVIGDTYANFGTKTSMVGAGTKPNTSAAGKNQAAPSGWTTTSIAANSELIVNVTTAPTAAVRGLLSLTLQRT